MNITVACGDHVHELLTPAGTMTTDSSGTYIAAEMGTYWLVDECPPRWDFHPAAWVLRTQRLNELRRDVLAFLDNAGDGGQALAARVRKEHW